MYLRLLRENRNFRLLFFGQAISQLGDWFNAVAVYALLLDLTGSATAVAWMLITQYLPVALVGPLAGVVVDRVNRRRLMIAADLFRGVLILGLSYKGRMEICVARYTPVEPIALDCVYTDLVRTANDDLCFLQPKQLCGW